METKGDFKEYRVPARLSDFQKRMYMHLIDWKHSVIGEKEPGEHIEGGFMIVCSLISISRSILSRR
jgi:hypothetical protein